MKHCWLLIYKFYNIFIYYRVVTVWRNFFEEETDAPNVVNCLEGEKGSEIYICIPGWK